MGWSEHGLSVVMVSKSEAFISEASPAMDLSKPIVGFIGIGNMGKPMAMNLLKAGYRIIALDKATWRVEELKLLGAQAASSPREIAERSSIVITSLVGPKSVQEVVFGKNGLLEGLEPGKIFVDMTTNLPSLSRKLATEVAARGAEFLDAPVSGSVKPATEGTLMILVGGKRQTLEKVRPILQTMGNRIVYVGDNGMAASMKLVLQMHSATIMLSLAESLALASRLGLDPSLVLDILNNSIMRTYASQNKGRKVIEAEYSREHALQSMTENLDLVAESAREMQMTPPPLLVRAREIYHSAVAHGKGELDFSAVTTEMERIMKVKISSGKPT